MSGDDEGGGLLGRIAVHYKLITMEQLQEAALLQGRFQTKRFGEILVELGHISEPQLEKLLEIQQQAVEQMRRKAAEKRIEEQQVRERMLRPPSRPPAAPIRSGQAVVAPEPRGDIQPRGAAATVEAAAPGYYRAKRDVDVQAAADGMELEHTSMADAAASMSAAPQAEAIELEPTSLVEASLARPESGLAARATSSRVAEAAAAVPAPPGPMSASAREHAGPAAAVSSDEVPPRPPANPAAVKWLHGVLDSAVQWGASDVHVHATSPVRIRRFTQLMSLTDQPLPPAQAEAVLTSILSEREYHRLHTAGEVDLAYSVEGLGRFRANVYHQHRGYDGVFHFIPPRPPTLAELNLPTELAKITNFHQGLVLITGPGGCGKSSTLAALVNLINEERCDHILTIEDPIEYLHPSKRCLVNQRQSERHTESFARALRAALREDPDVICIGELRDLETISLALSAAETGHLVLGTLHTNSAIRTINRIIGVYPPNQQSQVRTMLSESLRAVISQRLMPNSESDGVVLGLETLYVNKAVSNLIRENRTFQIHSVLQTGRAQGMRLLDLSLAELVKAARITRATAAANAENPATFKG